MIKVFKVPVLTCDDIPRRRVRERTLDVVLVVVKRGEKDDTRRNDLDLYVCVCDSALIRSYIPITIVYPSLPPFLSTFAT